MKMFKPKFSITNRVNNNLTHIERVRGFLEATKLKENWLTQMRSKAFIAETHYSTHIEGTQLTLEQSRKILTGRRVTGIRADDRKELLNYKEAMEFVSQYLGKGGPISEELIKKIHRILVKDVRGKVSNPGKYRKVQNYVVNSLTGEIIYTPPPVSKVPNLIKEFIEWLNNPGDLSPVIISGVAQFQFVHVHPFLDGNGRTARLLSTLILYKTGYDFKRLFSLSEYYDKERKEYYRAIQSVREHNMDMTHWLEYFTEGLRIQMAEVQEKGKKVIKRDVLSAKAMELGLNKRQKKVLISLVEVPFITRKEYQEKFKISGRMANYDLLGLQKKNLIEQVGKGPSIRFRLK